MTSLKRLVYKQTFGLMAILCALSAPLVAVVRSGSSFANPALPLLGLAILWLAAPLAVLVAAKRAINLLCSEIEFHTGYLRGLSRYDPSEFEMPVARFVEVASLVQEVGALGRRLNRERSKSRILRHENSNRRRRHEGLERFNLEFNLSLGKRVDVLHQTSIEVEDAANGLLEQSRELKDCASSANSSVEISEQTAQAVAQATAHLAVTTSEIEGKIRKSLSETRGAVGRTRNAGKLVEELSMAVSDVNSVLSFIENLAFQIAILAVNATIESARAGEAGAGFAVIAGEVKALANQAERATGEIEEKIRAVQGTAVHISETIVEIVSVIQSLEGSSEEVAKAVIAQNQATDEINQGAHMSSSIFASLSKDIKSVRDAAEFFYSTADSLFHTSADLAEQSSALRDGVAAFVSSMEQADDRRIQLRVPASIDVNVKNADGNSLSGQISDFSSGGASIAGQFGLVTGEIVSLSGLDRSDVAARVIDCGNGVLRVVFMADEEQEDRIRSIMARHSPTGASHDLVSA